MKILLKILKKNARNSIVCVMSAILVAIMLFVFLGVKELVLGTMSMEERVRSQQGVAIQTYMYILLFMPYYKSQEFEQGELLNRIEFDASIIVDYYMDFVSSIFMIIGNFFISLYFLMKISNILTLISVVLISLMYARINIFKHLKCI